MIQKYNLYLEKYNSDRLNELIEKHFNDSSEEIIEIIDSYEGKNDVRNILEKISFIIESVGDVIALSNDDDDEIFYYIDMKDDNKLTFMYDVETNKFMLKTLKNK